MKPDNVTELVAKALIAGLIVALCVVTMLLPYLTLPFRAHGLYVWAVMLLLQGLLAWAAFSLLRGEGSAGDGARRQPDVDDDPVSDAAIVRGMIEKENGQVNFRVTWMITFEGLLFTGLGLAINTAALRPAVSTHLVWSFATAGITVAAASMWGMCGATAALFELRLWHQERYRAYDGAPIIGLDPPFWPRFGRPAPRLSPTYRFGWFVTIWNLLPIALIFSWLMVLHFIEGFPFVSALCGTADGFLLLMSFALSMTTYWPDQFARAHAQPPAEDTAGGGVDRRSPNQQPHS